VIHAPAILRRTWTRAEPRWQSGGSNLRCRGNTWFIPYDTIKNRETDRPHPATFPPRVPEYCLRLHGLDRLQLVVDPFLGLGSTAIACAKIGADFAGVEIDEHYLNQAVTRTREFIANPSLNLEP